MSGAAVADVAAWVRVCAERIHDEAGLLTDLDAAIGDADHGSNLDRGLRAVVREDRRGVLRQPR